MTIEKATRVGVTPLIVLYGESGTGKSMTALLVARGLAGPDGLIIGVDTESRRLSLYADVIPNGFSVINLEQPFSPKRYMEAGDMALAEKPACLVFDSGSHEWSGLGGVCDMAAASEEKTGKPGLHNFKAPKTEHQHWIQWLLRCPVPVVVCLRAKHKTKQTKGTVEMFEAGEIEKYQIGRTVIKKQEEISAITSDDFIFEATAHMQILQDHTIVVSKCNHPDLRKCFPADRERPITIEDGAAVGRWCKSLGQPEKASADPLKTAKAALWDTTKPIRGEDKTWASTVKWLREKSILTAEQTIQSLTADQLIEAAEKASIVIKEGV